MVLLNFLLHGPCRNWPGTRGLEDDIAENDKKNTNKAKGKTKRNDNSDSKYTIKKLRGSMQNSTFGEAIKSSDCNRQNTVATVTASEISQIAYGGNISPLLY